MMFTTLPAYVTPTLQVHCHVQVDLIGTEYLLLDLDWLANSLQIIPSTSSVADLEQLNVQTTAWRYAHRGYWLCCCSTDRLICIQRPRHC
jgi:hypothetical protein